jgi:hypothetical protein
MLSNHNPNKDFVGDRISNMTRGDFSFGRPSCDIDKAESCASETFDWLHCAEMWLKLHNNKEHALRCATEAEDCTKDYIDLHMCCGFWISVLPNVDKAKKCILQAEALIENAEEFAGHHSYWLALGDTVRARECLGKASTDEKIMTVMSWIGLADRWRLDFNDIDKASESMLFAEKMATASMDWMECALCWNRMGLLKERNRCLSIASRLD